MRLKMPPRVVSAGGVAETLLGRIRHERGYTLLLSV